MFKSILLRLDDLKSLHRFLSEIKEKMTEKKYLFCVFDINAQHCLLFTHPE